MPRSGRPPGQATALLPALRKQNPCLTLDGLATLLAKQTSTRKLSRERVRQILNRERLPTRHESRQYVCNQCGKLFVPRFNSSWEEKWGKIWCSAECRHAHTLTTLTCEICGKQFERKVSEMANNARRGAAADGRGQTRITCSKHCYGVWYGKTHGFAAHPEHSAAYGKVKVILTLTCAVCGVQFQRDAALQKHLDKVALREYGHKPQRICSRQCSGTFASKVKYSASPPSLPSS